MARNGRRLGLVVVSMAAALAVGVGLRMAIDAPERGGPGPVRGSAGVSGQVKVSGEARIGGPFALVDHHGRPVTEKDFRGAFMLVYFGYTFCPDVCPTELQAMSEALDALGAAAKRVRPVFVTVDPERDSVAVVADYVSNFHPSFVGLTGSPGQVAAAARAYGIYYSKVQPRDAAAQDAGEDYLMNHSSFIYLFDPTGEFGAAFRPGTDADVMATRIRSEIEKFDTRGSGA